MTTIAARTSRRAARRTDAPPASRSREGTPAPSEPPKRSSRPSCLGHDGFDEQDLDVERRPPDPRRRLRPSERDAELDSARLTHCWASALVAPVYTR